MSRFSVIVDMPPHSELTNQPGEPTKKGHAGMWPHTALVCWLVSPPMISRRCRPIELSNKYLYQRWWVFGKGQLRRVEVVQFESLPRIGAGFQGSEQALCTA